MSVCGVASEFGVSFDVMSAGECGGVGECDGLCECDGECGGVVYVRVGECSDVAGVCVVMGDGVGSRYDGSGSAQRSFTCLCFGGGVRLRWNTALLCCGRKSASLSFLLLLLSQLRLLASLPLLLKTASAASSQVGFIGFIFAVSVVLLRFSKNRCRFSYSSAFAVTLR